MFGTPALAGFSGTIRVIDGDTLDVGDVRVRLHGIDAPEVGQTCQDARGRAWDCGTWASREVRARYQNAVANCDPVDRDAYGRVVAVCNVAGRDMGRLLVKDGVATAFRKYSMAYDRDEQAAAAKGLGLHAGTFERPDAYRNTRGASQKVPRSDCVIKGNISAKGVRIFHVPGQRYYAATRISTKQGERWFCTADEARRAGWRKARW